MAEASLGPIDITKYCLKDGGSMVQIHFLIINYRTNIFINE